MITVPSATKKIIERSRYITEALNKNLINLSSLARYIQPEVETLTMKNVSQASILMSLKRLSKNLSPNTLQKTIIASKPTLVITSNLTLVTYQNSPTLRKSLTSLDNTIVYETKGTTYTTILIETTKQEEMQEKLKKETKRQIIPHLATITIKLSEETQQASGVYYFFLKSLAWENINIIALYDITNEFILVLQEKDIHTAFAIINSLF